jgi:CRISPR type III-A-associated RAMP protein Csm4
MQTDLFKLAFTGPLHIGRGSDELDDSEVIYHSDSLKSAIYATGLPFFEDWQDHEYFFKGFTISSAFPYCGNELFLPKPQAKLELKFEPSDLAETNVPKTAKKNRFYCI